MPTGCGPVQRSESIRESDKIRCGGSTVKYAISSVVRCLGQNRCVAFEEQAIPVAVANQHAAVHVNLQRTAHGFASLFNS